MGVKSEPVPVDGEPKVDETPLPGLGEAEGGDEKEKPKAPPEEQIPEAKPKRRARKAVPKAAPEKPEHEAVPEVPETAPKKARAKAKPKADLSQKTKCPSCKRVLSTHCLLYSHKCPKASPPLPKMPAGEWGTSPFPSGA